MANLTETPLAALYEADETAWLDAMARLAAERRFEEFDCENLSEFLESMARRDRRKVRSRMVVLLIHLLKWEHQPERRSNSWRGTIIEQRRELREILAESRTLRNHAEACFETAYQDAREQAAAETGLPIEACPAETSLTVDNLIARGVGPA